MFHLTKLYKITADSSLSFEQKITKLLNVGAYQLKMQLGIISEVNNETYTVKYVISPDHSLEPETKFSVNNTYCIHTLNADRTVSFHHAGKSNIAQHPCYLDFGLESYIGAPLKVDGKIYGTLNFSSPDPKPVPFKHEDFEFIDFLSHWIGNELTKNKQLTLLQNQQKKMSDQQSILNEIGKLARVGAWEVDLVKNRIFWSDATRQIHEVDDKYVPDLDTAINFYKEGDSRDRIQQLVTKAMEEGSEFEGEFEIVTYTGKVKWVASQGKAEIENGQCVRLYGAFQDITKQVYFRQQLEQRHKELTAALDARSTFLANMSHEIRTPINGVIGSLQVMDKHNLNDNQQHFLGLAQRSANSLLEQVNDVLDFAKIDSNQMDLETTPFLINELLSDCISVFSVSAKDKSIQLNGDFSQTQDMAVIADPTRIKQIYANLISNAIKFTTEGEVTVSSKIKSLGNGKHQLLVKVSDSGIGIQTQQLDNLFLPFRQADTTTTRKFGGTGLGLSISLSLAKLMDGDITIKSEEGIGSTFTVKLEVELQASQQSEASSQEEEKMGTQEKDLSQLKVLVVEDNFINQMVVSEMLKVREIPHDIAADGLEALSQLQEQAAENCYYSVILMDCQMPNMDGYQATENIRQLQEPLSKTPIIALTANAMKGDKEKCIESGMDDYLPKPIEQPSLYAMLERFI